jgi:hypothetical protein
MLEVILRGGIEGAPAHGCYKLGADGLARHSYWARYWTLTPDGGDGGGGSSSGRSA